jgi:type IV secretory pathway protease TraF
MPLLKPVAALPHEQVCVREDRLYIGERDYGRMYTSADGKVLPRVTDCFHIQPGEVFLASPVRGSMDSRYFGPIHVGALRAQAHPVLTWGE